MLLSFLQIFASWKLYVFQSITKIIERDFYPDLPQLRAQSEYLEAKARNDTEKLRELHIKYGPKRRKQTPGGSQIERPTTDICELLGLPEIIIAVFAWLLPAVTQAFTTFTSAYILDIVD